LAAFFFRLFGAIGSFLLNPKVSDPA
jgi:hypothetical protein